MEIKDLVAIAWKRRWLVLLVVGLSIASSAAFAFSKTAQYESTATIAVTPDAEENQAPIAEDALTALLGTYAQTAQSTSNLQEAEDLLGQPIAPDSITTSIEAGTGILRLSARSSDPQAAMETAEAVASAFEESLSDNQLLVTEIIGPPAVPDVPLQPRPPLIIAVGAVIGAAAALLLAVALEYFRRRIETGDDVTELVNAPVIGQLPRERELQGKGAGVVWGAHKMPAMQESLRGLRTNLEFLMESHTSVLQVTSAFAGEGKSTLVANLGIAFAQIGVETTIVDCDLRRPQQHQTSESRTSAASPTCSPRAMPRSTRSRRATPASR